MTDILPPCPVCGKPTIRVKTGKYPRKLKTCGDICCSNILRYQSQIGKTHRNRHLEPKPKKVKKIEVTTAVRNSTRCPNCLRKKQVGKMLCKSCASFTKRVFLFG